jgi:hypothetical protein
VVEKPASQTNHKVERVDLNALIRISKSARNLADFLFAQTLAKEGAITRTIFAEIWIL